MQRLTTSVVLALILFISSVGARAQDDSTGAGFIVGSPQAPASAMSQLSGGMMGGWSRYFAGEKKCDARYWNSGAIRQNCVEIDADYSVWYRFYTYWGEVVHAVEATKLADGTSGYKPASNCDGYVGDPVSVRSARPVMIESDKTLGKVPTSWEMYFFTCGYSSGGG